ncbi:putative ATP-grasp-modified RiPP [Nocardiopsis sp. CNT-189]|uniref:putative ATP-grasp-modified RiPP n=1 Tax=Nocardiopsis oceanisediminis TaxID=2816862 RepID=UPI003B39D2E6
MTAPRPLPAPAPPLPWGLSRMAPYPPSAPLPYTRVEIDPLTQTARRFDRTGQPIQAGKHGSNVARPTHSETPMGGDGDGSPGGSRTDTTTDYVPD